MLVFVPQPPILEMWEVVLWLSHQRGKRLEKPKQNKTAQNKIKPHKVSQVQMQYNFSKFFSMQV
jgi:hypothetical protein